MNMPAGDRRGPLGEGPMTGRGLGQCGDGIARRSAPRFGRGRGFGFSRGFGFGYRGYAVDETTQDEVQSMKSRIAELEELVKNK